MFLLAETDFADLEHIDTPDTSNATIRGQSRTTVPVLLNSTFEEPVHTVPITSKSTFGKPSNTTDTVANYTIGGSLTTAYVPSRSTAPRTRKTTIGTSSGATITESLKPTTASPKNPTIADTSKTTDPVLLNSTNAPRPVIPPENIFCKTNPGRK